MLTPTATDLAISKPAPMTTLPPSGAITETAIAQMDSGGLEPAFTADLFSAFLTHERCGRHLYRSVATRTNNPVLRAKYESFGEETHTHVGIYQRLITDMGGDPTYVSPLARCVEMSDSKNLEATFLLG